MQKYMSMSQKVENFKQQRAEEKHRKQQELFKAEQKRADMKTALYHMAVWNVQEAGDIIKEIIDDNDKGGAVNGSAVNAAGGILGPKSVAEKVREKAAIIRRNERLGIGRGGLSNGGQEDLMGFGHYENGHAGNGSEFERVQSTH